MNRNRSSYLVETRLNVIYVRNPRSKNLTATTVTLLILSFCATLLAFAGPAQAQTQAVLYNFTGSSDGASPQSRLTFDANGNLYGTAPQGGMPNFDFPLGAGVIFKLSPDISGKWNETVLHAFNGGLNFGPGGAIPIGPVVFDKAGNIYGATVMGGTDFYYCNYGSLFQLSSGQTTWTESILYSFSCTNPIGILPMNGVIMDAAGNLYGTTTPNGGIPGTVFELSPSNAGWIYQTIYTSGVDNPTGVTMDAAGNIYGATTSSVFQLSPNGSGGFIPNVIHTFAGPPTDGINAMGTPALDRDGNLYGTTYAGGASDNGTVYKLSPGQNGSWKEEVLYSFTGGVDGGKPIAGVSLDLRKNIYGTTSLGGTRGKGTVFELKGIVVPFGNSCGSAGSGGTAGQGTTFGLRSSGTVCYRYVPLWSFKGLDGANPSGSPVLDNACNLYGTTPYGGLTGKGVVYKVSVPISLCLP